MFTCTVISPVLFYTVYEQSLAHACPQGSVLFIWFTIEIFILMQEIEKKKKKNPDHLELK